MGKHLEYGSDGAFKLLVPITTGTNLLKLTATDPAGNTSVTEITVRKGTGKLTAVQQGDKPWTQSVEIAPHDVAFLVLK